MVRTTLLEPEKNIITHLCKLHIESLIRIATNSVPTIDLELRCLGAKVSRSDVAFEIAKQLEQFELIKSKPEYFLLLERDKISIMADMLLNYAEEFEGYGKSTPKFWHKLFLIQFCHEHAN